MNNIITVRLKNNNILCADCLRAFIFKINEERQEIEVYRNEKLLGQLQSIIGIDENEFLDYLNNMV